VKTKITIVCALTAIHSTTSSSLMLIVAPLHRRPDEGNGFVDDSATVTSLLSSVYIETKTLIIYFLHFWAKHPKNQH
jgi:hypothetical protein